jgi:lysine 2,3-aminomutase
LNTISLNKQKKTTVSAAITAFVLAFLAPAFPFLAPFAGAAASVVFINSKKAYLPLIFSLSVTAYFFAGTLLSGGDILTLGDREVMRFVDAFAQLPQVEVVRVCTRAVSVNPPRITAKLARLLGRTKKVWVNTQFNCADEVTEEARKAAALLTDAGVPVSCQTVLLKGVNDSAAKMLALLRRLSAARIRPYYVFQCDPVAGTGHFRVPLSKAKEIERVCAERIGGLAMPRFVADIPGARRKIPIDML